MKKKLKFTVFATVITFCVVLFGCAKDDNSQFFTPSIEYVTLAASDKEILDQWLTEYVTFTMSNKRELVRYLRSNGNSGTVRLRIGKNNWVINLELNDLRTSDFECWYTTDEGTFPCPPFEVNTYQGKTSTGLPVAFTIDENTFFGVILGGRYHYMIRSVSDFTQNREDKTLVLYHSWNYRQ